MMLCFQVLQACSWSDPVPFSSVCQAMIYAGVPQSLTRTISMLFHIQPKYDVCVCVCGIGVEMMHFTRRRDHGGHSKSETSGRSLSLSPRVSWVHVPLPPHRSRALVGQYRYRSAQARGRGGQRDSLHQVGSGPPLGNGSRVSGKRSWYCRYSQEYWVDDQKSPKTMTKESGLQWCAWR